MTGGPCLGSGSARTASAGTPIAGARGQDLGHPPGSRPERRHRPAGRVGRRVGGPQVGQRRCGGVYVGDGDTLALQGRDDLAGPGSVRSAPVGFELGVNPRLTHSLQLYWGGPSSDGPLRWDCTPGQGLSTGWGLGVRLAPDAALGLVNLASRVQVKTSQHSQRRVAGIGLGVAWCQVAIRPIDSPGR